MRRLFIALFVVAAFAGSAFAQAAQRPSIAEQKAQTRITKEKLQAIAEAAPVMPLTLTALFTVAADQIGSNGVFIPADVPNIIVARKNDDGSISTTCVTSEAAARAFMQQHFRQEPSKPAEQ
jgi:hypothetical protein